MQEVDLDMGANNDRDARNMKGNILKSVTFTSDGSRNRLSSPRNLLVMSAGNIRSLVSAWVRNDESGEWTRCMVKSGTLAKATL